MDKDTSYSRQKRSWLGKQVLVILCIVFSAFVYLLPGIRSPPPHNVQVVLERCQAFKQQPGPPPNFQNRKESDRHVTGTKPTLVKNAKVWTGAINGTEVIYGDILLDKGLIMGVGHFGRTQLKELNDLLVVDAKGRWVTPGIVDLHSHLGDAASPELEGALDDNSLKGTISPWMRSLDGLNTHDASYALSISGGVTTALILPGSANAIGGQAFPIKLRKTTERSPSSMLLEPPFQVNSSTPLDPSLPPRWRHMKHACGENPSRVYSNTRMDTIWAFREAYNKARTIMKEQDEYCAKVESGMFKDFGDFPEDLQWESLVDVLRGRVKVNIHCYEAVDLDGLVRLSNEFKFPIAAFHHAHETYLVPDLLKRAYGKPPAVALFATNARYKREAYRGSEFAPRILAENGLTVLMKSDHPVLNSRYLLYEAQQAHYYGFPDNLALASVTSNSAEIMGMGHRVGYIKKGWDADLVIWDSHPLALGATPVQVFIDGIAQIQSPVVAEKPVAFQKLPKVPDFDEEAQAALKYDGLPPLTPSKTSFGTVVFTNVTDVLTRSSDTVKTLYTAQDGARDGVVVAHGGRILCAGSSPACLTDSVLSALMEPTFINLKGGSVEPALTSYGSPLGLQHIDQEPSTNDGLVYDPLAHSVPKIVGGSSAVARAVDGLLFNTRDAQLAYRAGVTRGIVAPSSGGFFLGLGTMFSTGSPHKLEEGALIQEVTALHTAITFGGSASISTQVATLRRLLLDPLDGAAGVWFKKVTDGRIPLVVETNSADVIATLLILKSEVELAKGRQMKMTIAGANEAHLLAEHLGKAGVGVIVYARPFPTTWEMRRISPGPPLSESAIAKLVSHNVTVGLRTQEIWDARNLAFDVAWSSLDANGILSKEEALALGSVNLEKLLGAEVEGEYADMVARSGGDLFEGKVAGILSPRRRLVDMF